MIPMAAEFADQPRKCRKSHFQLTTETGVAISSIGLVPEWSWLTPWRASEQSTNPTSEQKVVVNDKDPTWREGGAHRFKLVAGKTSPGTERGGHIPQVMFSAHTVEAEALCASIA